MKMIDKLQLLSMTKEQIAGVLETYSPSAFSEKERKQLLLLSKESLIKLIEEAEANKCSNR